MIDNNDIYINYSVAAYHHDREAVKSRNLNEINNGLGLERDSGNFRQMIGGYKNSNSKTSVYALVGYTPLKFDNFKFGVVGGGLTGYGYPITPAGGLFGTYQFNNFGVNITIVPDAHIGKHKIYGFTGLQLRYILRSN